MYFNYLTVFTVLVYTLGVMASFDLPCANVDDEKLKSDFINSSNAVFVNNLNNTYCKSVIPQLADEHINDCEFKYYEIDEIDNLYNRIQNSNVLSIFHVNIRSLNANSSKLTEFLDSLSVKFDCIILSEIWSINLDYYSALLPGYSFTYTKPINVKCGGIGMFVKASLPHSIVLSCNCILNDTVLFEAQCMSVQVGKQHFNILGVYRHPNTSIEMFLNELTPILNKVVAKKKYCILSGDINIDLNKYNQDYATKSYVDLLLAFNLLPYVFLPTRITNTSSTIIDHLFTNCDKEDRFIIKSGISVCDIADHFGNFVYICNNTPNSKNSKKDRPMVRIFSNKNIQQFLQDLAKHDWNTIYTCTDINDATNTFLRDFHSIYDNCFPLIKQSRSSFCRKNWMTAGLIKSIKTKSKLYKNLTVNRSIVNVNKYRKYKHALDKLIAKAKYNYYNDKLNTKMHSSREIWKTLNSMCIKKSKNKANLIHKIINNNKTYTNEYDIANCFNKFFSAVGKNLSDKIPNSKIPFMHYLRNKSQNSFFSSEISFSEIKISIHALNNTKSIRPGTVSSSIIKLCSETIVYPLHFLFNLSLETGVFPDALKIATVIPLHKKGAMSDVSNYRPISLLSVFSKIFEKVMHSRFKNYFNKYNILHENQFGFRKGHSTTDALISSLDYINMSTKSKKFIIGLFCDISKAFDTVNHDILLKKLEFYGIRGAVLNWVTSYLYNRVQCTVVNNVKSDLEHISCGVPQGSVLGPLFFLIYINDIINIDDEIKIILFADDTNIFITASDMTALFRKANEICNKLYNWYNSNKLSLNLDKTHYIIFNPGKLLINLSLTIGSHAIKRESHTTFLGVTLDEYLTWNKHIESLVSYIKCFISVTRKKIHILPSNVRRLIYFSLIYSKIYYAIQVYGRASASNLKPLQVTLNSVLRFLQNVPRRYHNYDLFFNFNTLPLMHLYRYSLCILMHKCIYYPDTASYYLRNSLLTQHISHRHSTRSVSSYASSCVASRSNSNVFFVTFAYSCITLWNHLPQDIKQIKCTFSFKNKLIKHFTNELH